MKLSVIVPCFDAMDLLEGQLVALSRQSWSEPWEVLIADNGRNDGLAELVEQFADAIPNLRIVDATARRGRSFARNAAAKAALGRSIAFCDADDEVDTNWVRAIGEALEKHQLVGSHTDLGKLNVSERQRYLGKQYDGGLKWMSYPPYLPFASGCGLGIRRALHHRIGGFDEAFIRAQDTEYCVRAQRAGAFLHHEQRAVVYYRHRSDYSGVIKQGFPWAYYAVLIYRRHSAPEDRRPGGWRAAITRLAHLLTHPPRGTAAKMNWMFSVSWCVGLLAGGIRHGVEPPVFIRRGAEIPSLATASPTAAARRRGERSSSPERALPACEMPRARRPEPARREDAETPPRAPPASAYARQSERRTPALAAPLWEASGNGIEPTAGPNSLAHPRVRHTHGRWQHLFRQGNSVDTFDFEALEACPDRGPVFMLNLIKFREHSLDGDGSGRDAYKRYLATADGLVAGVGGSVRWVGKVQHAALCEGDIDWDRALLVFYPDRDAFLNMINNPAYHKANIHRRNGVEKHVILASATVFDGAAVASP